MPFSVQASAAGKAGNPIAPVAAIGGTADAPGTGLGDTFAALMQACLPAAQSSGGVVDGQSAKASQQPGATDPHTRTRKSAADQQDPSAAQLLVAQLSSSVVLPNAGSGPQSNTVETPEQSASSLEHDVDTTQAVASDTGVTAAAQASASMSSPSQTAADATGSMQELMKAMPPSPNPADPVAGSPASKTAAEQSSTPQQAVSQANLRLASSSSAPATQQTTHPALTATGITIKAGDTAAVAQQPTDQQRPASMEAQPSRLKTASPIFSASALSSHQAGLHAAASETSAISNQSLPASSTVDSNAQGVLTQAGFPNQAAPVPPGEQAFGGDDSSGPQDDEKGGTPADRKGSQGSPRTSASFAEGDTRVGMSGWLGTTRPYSEAATQRTGSEAATTANSGMTNLSLDRIASDSSARRLTNALRSDMSFGVQTATFGKVNIQAALHGDQLASQISLEHAHLNASTLAAHMPVLESTLGEKYKLDATVTVQSNHAGMSGGGQQSSAQGNGQHTTPDRSPQTNTPVATVMAATSNVAPGRLQVQERLASTAGRLDLVI